MKILFVCLLIVCPAIAQSWEARPAPRADAPVLAENRITAPQEMFAVRPVPYSMPREVPETPRGRGLFAASVAALAAANVADLATSWGRREGNPLIASPNARFGPQSALLKTGFTGVSLAIQWVALRRNPRIYRSLAYTNFAIAGGMSAVAVRNASVPR